VIQIKADTRIITATTTEGVILTHTAQAPKEHDDFLVLPASVLPGVEGSTENAVTLERQSKLRAVVRWQGGSKPGTLPVGLITPDTQHEIPKPPELSPVSDMLLSALHECARSAARGDGRFSLSRIQLQGKAGRVVGTDSKVALLSIGFSAIRSAGK